MKFLFASAICIFSGVCIGHAQTQNWSFETENATATIRHSENEIGSIEFRCLQAGTPNANPDLVQWWIKSPLLLDRLSVDEGELVSIALELDGADSGTGPFVRQGEFLATQVEKSSAMVSQLRAASALGLGQISEPAIVNMTIEGLDESLNALLEHCAQPSPPPKTSQDLVDCAAPANRSEETICTTPELRTLETELSTIAKQQRDGLDGPPKAAFITDQTAWNKVRSSCGTDVPCLRNSVTGRIAYLNRDNAPASPQPTPTPEPSVAEADTAPPPLQIPAVQALQPAQFGAVLYDQRQITQRMIIEMVRQNPLFLDQQRIQQAWYRVAISGGKSPRDQAEYAQAKDHLTRSVAAQPAGPFLIAHTANNPFINARYEQGVLKSAFNNKQSSSIGRFQSSLPGVSQVEVRSTSQFDLSRLQVGEQQAKAMQDPNLKLLVVAEISRVHIVGSPAALHSVLAEGQVRYVALKRPDPPTPHNQKQIIKRLDPSLLAIAFSPTPPTPPAGGVAAAADILGLPMYQNTVLEGQNTDPNAYRNDGVQTLIRLAGLRAHPPETISPQLRAYTFNVLASETERDITIPPVFIDRYDQPTAISFSRNVDEFDRPELEDRIDKQLWPRVLARLPQTPFEGIFLHPTSLGEYDRSRGGFPIRANVSSMGLAAQGNYPALKGLPEVLPISVDKARELVDYLDTRFGPGNRRVMLALRYRVDEVGPVDWTSNSIPLTSITPLALSIHANDRYELGEDPFAFKIMDFDVAAYRGAPVPVASDERIAFWNEIRKTPRSNADQITLAALGVSKGNDFLEQIVETSAQVRNANEFDKPAARQSLQAKLTTLEKPTQLVLQGDIRLSDYSVEEQTYKSTRLYFRNERGELGLRQPQISFANTNLMTEIAMPPDTARLFAGDNHQAEAQASFVAWVDANLLTTENRSPLLYVRAKRVVLMPGGVDATGYPPTHIEIAIPAPEESVSEASGVAQLSLDPPTMLPIDSEYIDLLMVQKLSETLNEATYLRMMEDRRMREQNAAQLGYPAPWGTFFENPQTELNPIQQRDILPAFIEWTVARSQQMPDTAYVQTRGPGMLPPSLLCWISNPAIQNDFERYLPTGMARALQSMEYEKQAVMLAGFDRAVSGGPHQRPMSVFTVYGRPSLIGTQGASYDNSTRACAERRRSNQAADYRGSLQWNALVSVAGAYRTPLPRDGVRLYRDIGKVEVTEIGPNTLEIALETERTEIFELGNGQGPVVKNKSQVLDETSLSQAPDAIDLFGIKPADDWSSATALAKERLPDAVVAKGDGPPPNFRRITQNTILGPMTEFQALRNGHVYIDTGKNEVLALLREAERDPDRVLAVASYRRFNAAQITQQQLIGALLQKYGPAPQTESDPSRYGTRPGQILSWGARAGCQPQMRDELRPNWTGLENIPNLREAQNLARQFRGPSLTYNEAHSMIYSGCTPAVWASVGEDREGVLHLVVWSLDMGLLDEVAKRPDPMTKADGDDGSQSLIDNAADIDL